MRYYVLGTIICFIVLSVFLVIFKHIKNRKNKRGSHDSFTVTIHNKSTIDLNSTYPIKLEPDPIIGEYFEELNQIKALYTKRETDPDALEQCIKICYLNINKFPMFLDAIDFNVPISIPAFERLAIIFEKQEKYKDALEIAQLQAYFTPTEKCLNRVNRLTNKVNKNLIDKSTGNNGLHYHFNEIKRLKGELPEKIEKIFDIIRKAPFKFDLVHQFVNDYVVLDVETTGLNYNLDSIVEIGCIKFKNNTEVDRFHTLINPNTPIPPQATEIHNITDEMVKDAPYIDEKLQELIDFIGNDIIIGHNVGFDIRFVINACLWAFIPTPKFKAIDTLKLAKDYIPKTDVENYSLETLRQFLCIDQIAHRALNDCEASAKLYQYCYNKNSHLLNTIETSGTMGEAQ